MKSFRYVEMFDPILDVIEKDLGEFKRKDDRSDSDEWISLYKKYLDLRCMRRTLIELATAIDKNKGEHNGTYGVT